MSEEDSLTKNPDPWRALASAVIHRAILDSRKRGASNWLPAFAWLIGPECRFYLGELGLPPSAIYRYLTAKKNRKGCIKKEHHEARVHRKSLRPGFPD